MKLKSSILAVALSFVGLGIASADLTVLITGSSAYRNAAITGIEKLYNGANVTQQFGCIYAVKPGVTSEFNASQSSFQGTLTVNGTAQNVIIKTGWSGSVGGLEVIAYSLQMSAQSGKYLNNNAANNAIPAVGTTSVVYDSSNAPGPTTPAAAYDATLSADGAFSDCYQSTASTVATAAKVISGLTGVPTADGAEGIVGVVPFEIVVNNGVTGMQVITLPTSGTGPVAPYVSGQSQIRYSSVSGGGLANGQLIGGKGIPPGTTIASFDASTITLSAPTNDSQDSGNTITAGGNVTSPITNCQAIVLKQLLTNGGLYLSQFTGNVADNTPVWALGRNADSGTRVAYMAESGRGTSLNQQVIQPAFTPAGSGSGKDGSPSRQIANLYRWPSDGSLNGILGKTYSTGQSGYGSGADLANALTAWGSKTATITAGAGNTAPSLSGTLGFNGWLIAVLGRGDAATATASTFGANTAHRLTWNGESDWDNTGFKYDGRPVSGMYNDAAVQEGRYTLWEYEHFYTTSANITGGAPVNDVGRVLQALGDSIRANDPGTDSIPVTGMHVTRGEPGSVIAH